MTDKIRISVCMAAYNGEKFIKEQLQSILSQLTSSDEVIIVNDGSSDRTIEIIDELCDPRICVIDDGANRGVMPAFERALRAASGEIVFLSDQDDIWVSQKIKEFLDVFETHPRVAVVISDAVIIDGQGVVMESSNFVKRPFRPGLLANLYHSRYIGCMMAFRSALLSEVLPFPGGASAIHDVWIGIYNHIAGGATWYIDKPLIQYRRHGANVTGVTKLPLQRQVRMRVRLLWTLGLRLLGC